MTRPEAIAKAKALANDQQRPYQVLIHKYHYRVWRIEFAGAWYSRAWKNIGVYHPKAPKTTSQQLALAISPTFYPSQGVH